MLHFKTEKRKNFFLRKRCLASISISILCFFTPLSHFEKNIYIYKYIIVVLPIKNKFAYRLIKRKKNIFNNSQIYAHTFYLGQTRGDLQFLSF